MTIVEKIKETIQDVHQTFEESGTKDKAKGVALTTIQVLGEGITEIEKSIEVGFASLEQKYDDNLKRIQDEKVTCQHSLAAELQQLATLHSEGKLSDDEFSIAKECVLKNI